MSYFDKIIGASTLVLGLLVMAAILSTDAYSTGARVDARGYDALNHLIVDDSDPLCFNNAAPVTRVGLNARTVTQ